MIVNRQHRVRVPVKTLGEFLAHARKALRLPPASITVCLVDNIQMARWNRAYRGKQGPTDVLSFPSLPDSSTRSKPSKRTARALAARNRQAPTSATSSDPNLDSYLGDIAIAPAVARRNARQFGRTFDQEMRILILHGMLHLMGYDHETDAGQMDRRERRLRRSLGLA
jgi:probable rRNA maturation factor